MTGFQIFILASSIVVVALQASLAFWIKIFHKVDGPAKIAAAFYAICFSLYSVGQALVILQVLKVLQIPLDISSYLYALAAILFAIGSYYQFKSLK